MTHEDHTLKRQSNLSSAKRELLQRWRHMGAERLAQSEVQGQEHARPQRQGLFPLSFAQQRLWFLDQLEPQKPLYNVFLALLLQGSLQVTALAQSLQQILQRHDVLRASLEVVGDLPMQRIAAPEVAPPPELKVIDISSLSEQEKDAQRAALVEQEATCPFDLARDQLLRCRLVRLGLDEHVLLITMHHIVSDGWSVGVLQQELNTLYSAYAQHELPFLTPLPTQYTDYVLWQRERLQGAYLEQQIEYWREQLREVPILELPTDRQRPAIQSFRGKEQHLLLPLSLSDDLKALSRREGVTLFMALLAAFQVLLAYYCHQDDIAVGVPVTNRTRSEFEGLIGFFVNTLVLRSKLASNQRFVDFLQHVRRVCVGAYAHQDIPFERIVEVLQPERDLSRPPLFQVLMMLQDTPWSYSEVAGLHFSLLPGISTTAKFDMTLIVTDGAQGLHCALQYCSDLFEEATIKRMLAHWQTLLEGIVAGPEKRLSDLSLLSSAERRLLLLDWNNTRASYPDNVLLHTLFEAQVWRTPEAVAVICEDACMTYAALNLLAERVAEYLRSRGVGAEVRVGVYLERSIELLVALLGVLKAGGAYVPLDPTYPLARLHFMIQDAQISLVLTQNHLQSNIASMAKDSICLAPAMKSLPRKDMLKSVCATTPENLAYVIYTSGSTGVPKGVMISHKAVLNTLHWLQEVFCLDQKDIIAQKTSSSFTDSVWEFFWPVITGARMVIIDDFSVKDPRLLIRQLRNGGITITQFVPALMDALLEVASSLKEEALLPALKWVFNGGEMLPVRTARRWYAQLAHAKIANIYGMTESAIYATSYILEQAPASEQSSVLIGKPIGNAETYIITSDGQLCSPGTKGEICIGGKSLARGYLNHPELTAEKFIPHPFCSEPSARLYRTGDLGRYLPDGNIECLGRIDHQVKVRGFRVELGEVETIMSWHPAVRKAVVALREIRPGDKRLVGYVLPEQGHEIQATHLRSFLKEKLPEYMVPDAIVIMEAFPVTINGKVHRDMLPLPTQHDLSPKGPFVPARTPIEHMLANIWMEILNLDQVGINDNFFELGGHSMLAIQILSRVRKALQIDVPLRTLFMAPKVAELAAWIEQNRMVHTDSKVVTPRAASALETHTIPRRERNGACCLSPAQQRLWLLDQLESGNPLYNIPIVLYLTGRLELATLEQSFNEIVRRHEILCTAYSTENGQPVQVVIQNQRLSLLVMDLQHLPAHVQQQKLLQISQDEMMLPFDLAKGCMIRARVLRLDRATHVLLITVHHIACDEWSGTLFMQELSILYNAFACGKPSPLTELPIQYADFAIWQQHALQETGLETGLAYWRQQLANIPATFPLPTDYPRSALQDFKGSHHILVISSELTARLKELSSQEHVTPFMMLLAAFYTLLSFYSNQEVVFLGTPSTHRVHTELERLIGFFVNTLVLRAHLTKDMTFKMLLEHVRDIVLDAYVHQDVPFEEVVRALRLDHTADHMPLLQVWFVLHNAQNASWGDIDLHDLKVNPVRLNSEIARYDLKLGVWEGADKLTCLFSYKTSLFKDTTIAQLAQLFEALVAWVVAQPDSTLQSIMEMLKSVGEQYQHQYIEHLLRSNEEKLRNSRRKVIKHIERKENLRHDVF
jgi:amino acid adenylation domain-containing protein